MYILAIRGTTTRDNTLQSACIFTPKQWRIGSFTFPQNDIIPSHRTCAVLAFTVALSGQLAY